MRFLAMLALVLSVFSITTSVAEAQQARNVAEFCGVHQRICNRTCPAGPGACAGECASRRNACSASGCFHYNRGGSRCFANTSHRAATDASLARNPDRERRRRGLR